ncbi:hypothetical protein [Staphylococcus phage LY01]|nr:hypothetical protein [Staphylococcus phage LY01]
MLKRLYELLTKKRYEPKLEDCMFIYHDHRHLNEVHEYNEKECNK